MFEWLSLDSNVFGDSGNGSGSGSGGNGDVGADGNDDATTMVDATAVGVVVTITSCMHRCDASILSGDSKSW